MVKLLENIGLNRPLNEEDLEAYHDYFAEGVTTSSDESSSEEEEPIQPAFVQPVEDIADVSLLRDVPIIEDVNLADLVNIDDVIIEIERNTPNVAVVDEEDEGDEVIVNYIDEEQVLGTQDGEKDQQLVESFLQNGCGCKEMCCNKFDVNKYLEMRLESAELDYYDNHYNLLDQVILGQLRCLTNDSDTTNRSHKTNADRKQNKTSYLVKGQKVCKNTFMFCHQIKIKRMKRLTKHFNENGIASKPHGNTGKLSKKVTHFKQSEFVVKFLNNYAEQNGIFLPGRSSTVYNSRLKLLPSSDSKKKVYEVYKQSFRDDMTEKPVSLKMFTNIWRRTCSSIVVMKPRSDLCSFCQRHYTSGKIMASASEDEKMEKLEEMKSHLETVKLEREFYKNTIKETREINDNDEMADKCAHYSFDMAQQVHIPSNPQQPGPIYFLVPFKVGIFGVMCETLNKQTNFLIPESVSSTKGSNLIVSLFDRYLEMTSRGEETIFIHADNCVGQNKNNILLGYLAWRITKKKNKRIVLSFMPVGHTKFSCDWAFGLLKRKFRTTFVSSLNELENCIKESTPTSNVNTALSVGDEKGNVHIQVYDWLNFFKDGNCKKVPLITKFNHFTFDQVYPGKVHCKTDLNGNENVFTLFPTEDGPSGYPAIITPAGKFWIFKILAKK